MKAQYLEQNHHVAVQVLSSYRFSLVVNSLLVLPEQREKETPSPEFRGLLDPLADASCGLLSAPSHDRYQQRCQQGQCLANKVMIERLTLLLHAGWLRCCWCFQTQVPC